MKKQIQIQIQIQIQMKIKKNKSISQQVFSYKKKKNLMQNTLKNMIDHKIQKIQKKKQHKNKNFIYIQSKLK